MGLFSGKLIFGGAYYWMEFCVSKWVGSDNKTASTNSPWAYIWEGLLSEGFLRLRFGGLIFGRVYFFLGGGTYCRNFTVYNGTETVSCRLLLRAANGNQLKLKVLRSAHTRGPVPATSPGDQVPPCEQLIFGKNLVAGTEFWSPQLVPRIQTALNSWDQSQGLVPSNFAKSLRVNSSWDWSLRPNKNINQSKTKFDCPRNQSLRVNTTGDLSLRLIAC